MEYCLIYTHEKAAKVGKCISLFYRFSRDLPPSKQILQGCNISTANYSATPQQHDVRIFIQLLLAIPPIHLVEKQFLKFSYLSHILHLVNTRCKNVTKQPFSASEYIGVAMDLMRSRPRAKNILFTQPTYTSPPCKVKYSLSTF